MLDPESHFANDEMSMGSRHLGQETVEWTSRYSATEIVIVACPTYSVPLNNNGTLHSSNVAGNIEQFMQQQTYRN